MELPPWPSEAIRAAPFRGPPERTLCLDTRRRRRATMPKKGRAARAETLPAGPASATGPPQSPFLLANKLLHRAGLLNPAQAAALQSLAVMGLDLERLDGDDYRHCEAVKAAFRRGRLGAAALEQAREFERVPGWAWAPWTPAEFAAFLAQLA